MTATKITSLRANKDEAQINLINAQNLYIVELEAKIKTLTELPLSKIMQFKQYYETQRKQFEEFKKKSV